VRGGGAQRQGWDWVHRGAGWGPPWRAHQGYWTGSLQGTSMERSSADPWTNSFAEGLSLDFLLLCLHHGLRLFAAHIGPKLGPKGRNGCGERGEGAERERESEERRGRTARGGGPKLWE
jgi:hypothetical protein